MSKINLRTLLSKTVSAIKEQLEITSFTWAEFEEKLSRAMNTLDAGYVRLFVDKYPYDVESVVIPEGIKNIPENTFDNCKKLSSITLPASLETVGNYANATAFEQTPFGKSFNNGAEPLLYSGKTLVYSKKNSDFYTQNSITELNIKEGVETLLEYSLAYFDFEFDKITFPSTLKYIRKGALSENMALVFDFSKCKSVPELGTDALSPFRLDRTIKVPAALLSAWKAAPGWSSYDDQMVGV